LQDLSNRLEKARKEKFKVLTLKGTRVEPPTKDECFAPDRLPTYLLDQNRRLETVAEGDF